MHYLWFSVEQRPGLGYWSILIVLGITLLEADANDIHISSSTDTHRHTCSYVPMADAIKLQSDANTHTHIHTTVGTDYIATSRCTARSVGHVL